MEKLLGLDGEKGKTPPSLEKARGFARRASERFGGGGSIGGFRRCRLRFSVRCRRFRNRCLRARRIVFYRFGFGFVDGFAIHLDPADIEQASFKTHGLFTCAFALAVSENIRPQVAEPKTDKDFLLGLDGFFAAAHQVLRFAAGDAGIKAHVAEFVAFAIERRNVSPFFGLTSRIRFKYPMPVVCRSKYDFSLEVVMVVLQLDEKCGDTPRPMREKCATPAWVDETSLEKQASPSNG